MVAVRSDRMVAVLSLLLSSVALTCGKSDDGRNAFAASYCQAIRPCCGALGLFTDDESCQTSIISVPPYARMDKIAADDCLNAINQLTNQGQSCQSDFSEPASCGQVFVVPPGTQAAGEACVGNLGCMPIPDGTAFCVTTSENNVNVSFCQSATRGQLGSPCIGDFANGAVTFVETTGPTLIHTSLCYTDDGLHCDGTTCVTLKPIGGSCATTDDCVRTAFCDGTVNQCAAPVAIGAACDELNHNQCQAGAYCDIRFDGSQCAPLVDLGGACGSDSCISGSCVARKCVPPGIGKLALRCVDLF